VYYQIQNKSVALMSSVLIPEKLVLCYCVVCILDSFIQPLFVQLAWVGDI